MYYFYLKIKKKLDIAIPPPILCIHIKRFKENGDKITSTVRVNFILDIQKYFVFLLFI